MADNDARTRGVDDDLHTGRCPLDIDMLNTAAREFFLQLTLELKILGEELSVVRLGVPVRVPVFVVSDPKAVWMYFLSHISDLKFQISDSRSTNRLLSLQFLVSVQLLLISPFCFVKRRGSLRLYVLRVRDFRRVLRYDLGRSFDIFNLFRFGFLLRLRSRGLFRRSLLFRFFRGPSGLRRVRLQFLLGLWLFVAVDLDGDMAIVTLFAVGTALRSGTHTATIFRRSHIHETGPDPQIVGVNGNILLLRQVRRVRDRRTKCLFDRPGGPLV